MKRAIVIPHGSSPGAQADGRVTAGDDGPTRGR